MELIDDLASLSTHMKKRQYDAPIAVQRPSKATPIEADSGAFESAFFNSILSKTNTKSDFEGRQSTSPDSILPGRIPAVSTAEEDGWEIVVEDAREAICHYNDDDWEVI